MADKKFSQFSVETDLSNFDGLVGFDTLDNYQITKANFYSDLETNLDLDNFTTGELAIAQGGTSSTTAQAAIDTLTNVAGATAGDILTESGGNAVWQAPAAGGTFKWAADFYCDDQFDTSTPTATKGPTFKGVYWSGAGRSNASSGAFYYPYIVPFDSTIIGVQWFFQSNTILNIAALESCDLRLYLFTNANPGDLNDQSVNANWTDQGSLGISFTGPYAARPGLQTSTPSYSVSAGDILLVRMDEPVGTIDPSTNDRTFCQLLFEST